MLPSFGNRYQLFISSSHTMSISLLTFNMKFLKLSIQVNLKNPVTKTSAAKILLNHWVGNIILLPSKLEWDILSLILYNYLHLVEFLFLCCLWLSIICRFSKNSNKKKKYIWGLDQPKRQTFKVKEIIDNDPEHNNLIYEA